MNVLGIVFDSKLKWGPQVSSALSKSSKALNAIRLIKQYFKFVLVYLAKHHQKTSQTLMMLALPCSPLCYGTKILNNKNSYLFGKKVVCAYGTYLVYSNLITSASYTIFD